MKNVLFIGFLLINHLSLIAQSSLSPEYKQWIAKADSLYAAKDYLNTAMAYSNAFRSNNWKGMTNDRYNAACAWALAGKSDSAFFQLERITKRSNYSDWKGLLADNDLQSLHGLPRWTSLVDLVKANDAKQNDVQNKPLLHLLDSLSTQDQRWRNAFKEAQNRNQTDSIAYYREKMILTDSLNYYQLSKILRQYAYPNTDLVGRGSSLFWLLVQHQDHRLAFQDSVLTLMKVQVDAGKASAKNYAYLVDRVKINKKELQVYGTQMQLNADSTSYEPMPLIDPEHLNERRLSVGLDSIEDYIALMNENFYGILRRKDKQK